MTTARICEVEPFRYQATPQPVGDQGASSNQINEQALEDYLSRMRVALCADIQALVDTPTGVDEFIDLLDTPDSYVGQEGKVPVVNAAETALEFFPSTFVGQANKLVVVAATEDGFALQSPPTPPSYFLTPRLVALWPPNITVGFIGPTPATVGGGQIQIVSSASILAATYRQQMTTGVGANAQAGVRSGVFQAIVGSAAPIGGFKLVYRFACELFTAGHRGFIGFSPNAAAFPTAASNPSALVNICALAFDATDTDWFFMQNDGAGAATRTPTGMAINTTSILELTLEVVPSGTEVIWRLRDLALGTEATATVSGNLPAGGTPLGLCLCANAAATGTAARLTHISMFLETGPGAE